MRVKICGITRADQGVAIAHLGATSLGFICVPQSPRYVTPKQIGAIATQLPGEIARIGVFADANLEQISHTVHLGQLTGVQLHGNESPDFCRELRARLPGIELIKALRVKSAAALEQAEQYCLVVDTLLLDAYQPGLLGGTGKTLDWQALQQFQPGLPWLLAGGLTPDNLKEALSLVQPAGIDLSSGVERAPGDKNLEAVAQLFQELQRHSHSMVPGGLEVMS